MFIVSLFLVKNITQYKKQAAENSGLVYNSEIIETLITKDTDKDGLLDWEESLWGTDPANKDTDGNGVGDEVEVAKLKEQKIESGEVTDPDDLTETDKFSRELFSTIVALNQAGAIDEATIDKLSDSLTEQIGNAPQEKVYKTGDIKIINKDDPQTIKNYNDAMDKIHAEYPLKGNIMDILARFVADENNTDDSALLEFDPIIEQIHKIINAILKMNVPQPLTVPHLNFVNELQKMVENLSDIRFYDNDALKALSAASQLETNIIELESAARKLAEIVQNKLNN